MPMPLAYTLLLGLILFTSCLPIPHRANVTPLVHGVIRNDGAPAGGVRLRVAVGDEDDRCGGKHSDVTTDTSGAFVVPPIRAFHWFLYPMAHRHFVWNLCVDAPKGWAKVHESRGYTLVDSGPWWFSKVTCDAAANDWPLAKCTEERDDEPTEEKAREILSGARSAGASDASHADELVGMVTRSYVDATRLNWARTAPRPVRTVIWYPIDAAAERETLFDAPPEKRLFVPVDVAPAAAISQKAQTYPLIVMSHGTGGSAVMMTWLGRHLASHGYIVAAVNHHGNTAAENELAPQGFLLYWERAADLRIAIDEVLRDEMFATRIDPARIGAAGFSLGGYTVIAAAGGRFNQREFDRFCQSSERDFTCGPQDEFPEAPARFAEMRGTDPVVRASLERSGESYRDPRIKAVFAIAPALGGGFTARDLRDVRVPVRIVVGAGDTVTPSATNAWRYASLIRDAQLTTLPGAISHYTFLHECTPRGRELLPICRDGAGVDRAAAHRTVAELALKFFNQAGLAPGLASSRR